MRKSDYIIVFVCDFNDQFALIQMKGVIYKINPKTKISIGSTQITPFSIVEGAFVIRELVNYYPKGSIFLGIIDPGVGTKRRGIFIKTKDYWFVGPDNGLFIPAIETSKIEKVYKIKDVFFKNEVSNTFHGRDVFSKVAAYLSLEKDPSKLGKKISPKSLVRLKFLKNQVLYIDSYGNIKINNKASYLLGEEIKINAGNHQLKVHFCKTFADVPPGEFLLYKGSNNTLELAINKGNAAKRLDIKVGDLVKIKR